MQPGRGIKQPVLQPAHVDKASVEQARVLLVDIENCPAQLNTLQAELQGITRVVICHAAADPKVNLSLLPLLGQALNDGRCELIRLAHGHPHAAILGLTFCAGRLMAELPPHAEFVILSRDTTLDHLVHLLRGAGRTVISVGSASAKAVGQRDPAPLDPVPACSAAAEGFREHLEAQRLDRPRRRKTLLRSIRRFVKARHLNLAVVTPQSVLQELVRTRALTVINAERIGYPDDPAQTGFQAACLADAYEDEIPF